MNDTIHLTGFVEDIPWVDHKKNVARFILNVRNGLEFNGQPTQRVPCIIAGGEQVVQAQLKLFKGTFISLLGRHSWSGKTYFVKVGLGKNNVATYSMPVVEIKVDSYEIWKSPLLDGVTPQSLVENYTPQAIKDYWTKEKLRRKKLRKNNG